MTKDEAQRRRWTFYEAVKGDSVDVSDRMPSGLDSGRVGNRGLGKLGMSSSISHQIRDFITENFLFGVSGNVLKDGDSLVDKGIIDSTGVLELVSFLEKTYGIQMADDELIPDNLESIAKMASFIARKQATSDSRLASELEQGKANTKAWALE